MKPLKTNTKGRTENYTFISGFAIPSPQNHTAKMKRNPVTKLLLSIFLVMFTQALRAQLSIPDVEAVYGGRINAMTAYAKTADTTRLFIATESANSVFYTDIFSNPPPAVFSTFKVFPAFDETAGYGSSIQRLTVHANSGRLFLIHQTGLLGCKLSETTPATIFSGHVDDVLAVGDYLFFTGGPSFHFGSLNASGNFSESSGSPLTLSSAATGFTIYVNVRDSSLFIFSQGSSPQLFVLSDHYDLITASSVFTSISTSGLATGVTWSAFGVAPSGRYYLVGTDGMNKYVAYSDDHTNWTSSAMGVSGITGPNIAFSGDSASYKVYTSNVYNDQNGDPAHWKVFGDAGFETHPNDGWVWVDPVNSNIVYVTTDQGIGMSSNGGSILSEIDDGVLAVQVNGFAMLPNKKSAWLASKSGIRKVVNFTTSPTWTHALFPNQDGSPYFSVDFKPADTNTVYVGNVRIYKTTDNGASWSRVFTPESAPYNFSPIGTRARVVKESYFDPDIIFAGYELQGTDKGGLFYSTDAGSSWDQILLEASAKGQDVDVSDVVFVIEGSDTVAYVSAIYDLSAPQGRSVYRLVKSGSSWTPSQDMNGATTSTGSSITATIWDLDITSTRDTIFAAGTNAGVNHPVVYYKPLKTTNKWTPMPVSGFPTTINAEATAVTVGIDTVYVAVGSDIYFFDLSGSAWQQGYSYPTGTKINFLYFDDLLVGTGTGLYQHRGLGSATSVENNSSLSDQLVLAQNSPNPFHNKTELHYTLPKTGVVKLEVFDQMGRKVATLVNEKQTAGSYSTTFDASRLSPGIYFYQLTHKQTRLTGKMIHF